MGSGSHGRTRGVEAGECPHNCHLPPSHRDWWVDGWVPHPTVTYDPESSACLPTGGYRQFYCSAPPTLASARVWWGASLCADYRGTIISMKEYLYQYVGHAGRCWRVIAEEALSLEFAYLFY